MDRLPSHLLQPADGPLAWTASDFDSQAAYTIQLSGSDTAGVDFALQSFLDAQLDPAEICPKNFPLPSSLKNKLQQCAETLHTGRGFLVLRGLGNESRSVEDNLIVFLGIASYIGDQRGLQNKQGHMLSHITESKKWSGQVPREERHGIHSNRPLPFHNDMGTDLLALQVRATAARGGGTYLASVSSILNDLLFRDKSALETLFEPNWPIQIPGRQARTTDLVRSILSPDWPPPKARHVLAPLFQYHDGRLMASVDPARLGPQPASGVSDPIAAVPDLSAEQIVALESLRQAAERNKVRVQYAAGDIVFLNNWAMLHSRDAYVDLDDEETTNDTRESNAGQKNGHNIDGLRGPRRHLVRLWLRNSELGWSVPEELSVPWLAAFGPHDNIDRYFPVEPMDVYPKPKYTAGSAAFVLDDDD